MSPFLENEGCQFQPYISSREYFFSNFILDSATDGQIFFVSTVIVIQIVLYVLLILFGN